MPTENDTFPTGIYTHRIGSDGKEHGKHTITRPAKPPIIEKTNNRKRQNENVGIYKSRPANLIDERGGRQVADIISIIFPLSCLYSIGTICVVPSSMI